MGVRIRFKESRQKWIVTTVYNGSRREQSFERERDARQFAAKEESELNEAKHNGVMGRRPRRTFQEGLLRWIDEYDVESQKRALLWVSRWMDENAPDVVIGQDLLDAARRMQKALREQGLAQSTINHRTQVVKRVLSLSYREWDWIDTPLDGKLRKPTPKNERHVHMTAEEMQELINAVPARYPVERRMITLALLTGMRRGEIFELEARNIRLGKIILWADQTKSGKARTIPLPVTADYLVGEIPFKATEQTLRKAFEKARAAIGRPDLRFHDLRHCYASHLAASGESMVSIKELLGHSSLTVTSRYAHAAGDRWEDIAGKLPHFCGETAASKI